MRRITVIQFLVSFTLCVVFRGVSCCEIGWHQYGEHCFRIYTDPVSMFRAKMKCIMEGSHLAFITDESVLQHVNSHLKKSFPGDRFWIGLGYDHDEGKLTWMDGTTALEEPWAMPYISVGKSQFTSAHINCFANNGTVISTHPCSERLGFICGHRRNSTTRAVCNSDVYPEHSFIGEATGNCLFRTPEKTTNAKVEELCVGHQGHFVDFENMMKDGLTAFYDHEVLTNDGSKYWTGLNWNGTIIIWSDSLPEDLGILFINGTGSCITVQFNFTNVFEAHLYQTDCDAEAQVVCSKTAESSENSTTTEVTTMSIAVTDMGMPSCPHGYHWKEDLKTGYCYWETSFDTDRLPRDDGEQYCQSFGGHLSSFHSLEEQDIGLGFYSDSLQKSNWIGLKLDPETETYKWSDGTPLDYTNWAPGHPDHKDKRLRCVAMDAKEQNWVSSLCGIHSWFICKAPKQINPPSFILPTPVPLQPCDGITDVEQSTVSYLFEGSCYFIVSESYNWYRAKQFCVSEGAMLVSIHSDGEVGFLLKLLHMLVLDNNPVWIGFNALGSDSSFRWTDWSSVDFTYFEKCEPNNFQNQEKCSNMDVRNGLWNNLNCNAEMSFICKRKSDTSGITVIPRTTDATTGNCRKGWIPHHDRCYYLGGKREKDRVNWTEAVAICLTEGGYLTSVLNDKEQGFLSYLLQSLRVDAWIGLHDTIQSGLYYWVDKSEVQYTKWAPGEPYLFGMKEDCVKMVYDTIDSGLWKDDDCEQKMGYICYSGKEPSTSQQPASEQSKSGLPTRAIAAVIVGVLMVLFLIVVAVVYFLKKSAWKKFPNPIDQPSVGFENVLYSVNSRSMELEE